MKIGIDADPLSRPDGGIRRALTEILRELQRIDQENHYYLYSKNDFDLPLENPRWHKCIHPRIPFMLGRLYLLRGMEPLDGNRGLDVFLLSRPHAFPFGLARTTARVALVYDLVWILYPDTMEWFNRVATGAFAGRAIRQADRIISISASTSRDMKQLLGTPSEKIDVVHLGVSARFLPRDRASSARLIAEKYAASPDYICTVGTVEPRKNLTTLIEAIGILHDRGQWRLQLLIAGGSGWKNSGIYASVRRRGLTEREVKFLGRVPDDDLSVLYAGARLFVFPSLYEGFGLPLIEAMASGVPVVASNVSSVPEVVADAGVLVSPPCPEEFADAIARVTGDPDLSRTLANRGWKRAQQFTWEAVGKKVLRVLQESAACKAQRKRRA